MFNYELAEELKDAGFMPNKQAENYVYPPTLGELVEACGGSFHALGHVGGDWQAVANKGQMRESAKSAVEAVAKLWLALNKK